MNILSWDRERAVGGYAFFWFLILLGLLLSAGPAPAEELLEAKYSMVSDNEVVVELKIGPAPPATLMVMQKIPPDARLTGSEPEVKVIDAEKNEAKWLLLGIQPGVVTINMVFDRKVAIAEMFGEIRYRAPQSGKMESVIISK